MAITNWRSDSSVATLTVVVAVRIPDATNNALVTEAGRRLGSIEGIRAVDVNGIQGLDPRLSATVITVTATVESPLDPDELRTQVSATVCVESIDILQSADT
jgi:acetolactate synthase regulatory subunit